jgi:zinc transporter ZupT
LLGVAIFWVFPEMAEFFGWTGAFLWIGAGCMLLALVDRYLYPVCPACSPAHDHSHCSTRLHGFALPLLIAASVHSLLDGWTASAAGSGSSNGIGEQFGLSLLAALAAHKIPEGLALGVIARASLKSPGYAMLWCSISQLAMLVGAGMESWFALGSEGLHIALALAGGSFLYLGWHAVHGEFRRSGPRPALVPALTGVAGSSVLRLLLR